MYSIEEMKKAAIERTDEEKAEVLFKNIRFRTVIEFLTHRWLIFYFRAFVIVVYFLSLHFNYELISDVAFAIILGYLLRSSIPNKLSEKTINILKIVSIAIFIYGAYIVSTSLIGIAMGISPFFFQRDLNKKSKISK